MRAGARVGGLPVHPIRKIPTLDAPARRICCDLELGSYDDRPKRRRSSMTIKILMTALAMTAGLLVMGSTARADKPLEVDCEALAATNECVNVILDEQGVQFRNLGDLVSSSILDPAVFDALDDLILL